MTRDGERHARKGAFSNRQTWSLEARGGVGRRVLNFDSEGIVSRDAANNRTVLTFPGWGAMSNPSLLSQHRQVGSAERDAYSKEAVLRVGEQDESLVLRVSLWS